MPDRGRSGRFGFGSRSRAGSDRAGGDRADRRRSGPPGEERWWRPDDQALAEQELLDRRTLGRGWRPAAMVNNVERSRPFGDDPDSAAIETARVARDLTGLDEGRAWRHRDAASLVVVRSEVYADPDDGVDALHREAWHRHAERALDATWRARWRERDREPGWIEARWVTPAGADDHGRRGPELAPQCDWLRIEDHTAATRHARDGDGAVTVYEHLTVWVPRRQVTVVIRHDVGLDLDDVVERCAAEVLRRLTV